MGKVIETKLGATQPRSRLVRRSFLIACLVSLAGGVLNSADAKEHPCDTIKRELERAKSNRRGAASQAARLEAQYRDNPQGKVTLEMVKAAKRAVKNLDEDITNLTHQLKNCR